jgi:hypothetical protein
MQTTKVTETELCDRYLAAQSTTIIDPELTREFFGNFGVNPSAPLPVQDYRGCDWEVAENWSYECSVFLGNRLEWKCKCLLLASNIIYPGAEYHLLSIIANENCDLALAIVTSALRQP